MNSILHNILKFYYYISWGMRIYSKYDELYVLLIYLKNIKISSIEKLPYYYNITFEDNSVLKFWDENRWYSWMSSGDMNFSNGKKLSWDGVMPSYEVLHEYRKIIRKYEKSKRINGIMNFSEYLPLKMIRKEKLKKINS